MDDGQLRGLIELDCLGSGVSDRDRFARDKIADPKLVLRMSSFADADEDRSLLRPNSALDPE
jgi:hypothetical protein